MPSFFSLRLSLTLIFLAVAGTTEGLRAADDAALGAAVEALPVDQPWQKLKKAALEWLVEDAKAAREQGFPDRAETDLQDVQTLLPKEIGHPLKAPENLFPPIPQPDTNPYAKGVFGQSLGFGGSGSIDKLINTDTRFAKGEAGNIVSDSTGWIAVRTAYEGEELAEALCHPQSPWVGDARLVAPMFRRFEHTYEYLVPNSKRLADFGDAPPEALMYLELKSVYPDLIPPSRRQQWERAIRVNSAAIMAAHEAAYEAAAPGTCYVNSDVKYTSSLGYAGLLFPETKYGEVSKAGVRLVKAALYPDGGFPYINWQNENFTYHAIAVSEMIHLWQVTGNPLAREIAEGTKNYYPLSIEPPGVAEYSTSACWKHYWHGATAGREAALVAQLTGDPQNMRVALMNPAKPDLLLATLYKGEITPAPVPDNYFVYDRNIQGPRGRFGAFSLSGTSRDYKGDLRGKSTYVGCMALYPPGAKSSGGPLSGALDTAGTEIRVKPGSGVDHNDVLNLAQPERNAPLVTRDFAAITTTHQLSSYGGKAADWQQQEGWLFTPNRLVGLVRVESLKDQTAYGVTGVLQYLHGWSKDRRQDFQTAGGNSFQYGNLMTRIHEHDYAGIQTVVPENTAEPDKYSRIVLFDQATGYSDQKVSYAKGARHAFLAELYPQWGKPADEVASLKLGDGLLGFTVREDAKIYRLILNSTDAEQTCSVSLSAGEVGPELHRNGEEYRPAWIEPDGREKSTGAPEAVTPANGIVTLKIPAASHVVLVSTAK